MWRLLPFVFLCYTVNYIDRVNLSFAALEMNADLHLGPEVFGLVAGAFFLGYTLFEIPSNLILEAVGARRWIARIMISWGFLTSLLSLVHTAHSLYALRFLLGVAEAGFFPGIIYYLGYWIPRRYRAKAAALFLTSTALSGVIGGPLAGTLMKMDGFRGLAGWRWLFLLEGIPAVILGVVTLFRLEDRISDAGWLAPADRKWLSRRMESEHAAVRGAHSMTLGRALTHPRVWHLCAIYFLIITGFYGIAFWLPQLVKGLSGYSTFAVSCLCALPYLCAAIAMVAMGRHSDATGERRRHVAASAATGAVGLFLAALAGNGHPIAGFLALCLAGAGVWSIFGPFWSLPATFLTGTAAAGGIALVNSCGNIGGFVGPYAVGYVKGLTGTYTMGLAALSVFLVLGALLTLTLPAEKA